MIRPYTRTITSEAPFIYFPKGFWRLITIGITPLDGATALVEYRLSDTTDYKAWPAGEVSTYTDDVLKAAVESLRITSYNGSTKLEIVL